jgi:Holliday junction resolvasome RuvABC endonuclease subunit
VAMMVSRLLGLALDQPPGDAADALALALCLACRSHSPVPALSAENTGAQRARRRG